MTCPLCSSLLEGLATYCTDCEKYVADMVVDLKSTTSVSDSRSEAEIRLAIRHALDAFNFVVVDFEQGYRKDGSTRVRKGLPDLYIMGHGVGVWRELKSAKGKPTLEQKLFGQDCRRCGIDWGVWRHELDAIEWAKGIIEEAA